MLVRSPVARSAARIKSSSIPILVRMDDLLCVGVYISCVSTDPRPAGDCRAGSDMPNRTISFESPWRLMPTSRAAALCRPPARPNASDTHSDRTPRAPRRAWDAARLPRTAATAAASQNQPCPCVGLRPRARRARSGAAVRCQATCSRTTRARSHSTAARACRLDRRRATRNGRPTGLYFPGGHEVAGYRYAPRRAGTVNRAGNGPRRTPRRALDSWR